MNGYKLEIIDPTWDNVNNTLTQNCQGTPASGWQNNVGNVSLFMLDANGNETPVEGKSVPAGAAWAITFSNIQRGTKYRLRTVESFYNPGFPPIIMPTASQVGTLGNDITIPP